MAFVKKVLGRDDKFLEPVISTPAIEELTQYFTTRFSKDPHPAAKPTVVTCFDTSGSGKTTTVLEASKRCHASVIIISPVFSHVLKSVLKSCHWYNRFKVQNGMISKNDVQRVFKDKFYAALAIMFERMESLVKSHPHDPFVKKVDEGDCASPNASNDDVNSLSLSCFSAFRKLRNTLGDRKLVIHVDDCQLFFRHTTPGLEYVDSIPAGEVMALALRCFSFCITIFARRKNIVWVFSGSRPTLLTHIILTCGLDALDISSKMQDLSVSDVQTILENYFNLSNLTEAEMGLVTLLCTRLSGPPKNIFFFLSAASDYPVSNIQEFNHYTESIERRALRIFRGKIELTFKGNMDVTARNLFLLHLTCMENGFVLVETISRHFIKLVEAGLLRIHECNEGWKCFAPNRLLVRVLQKYVRWYTWENIELLKSHIQASSSTQTLNGRVFEFLFALELCSSAAGKIWTFLHEQLSIAPLPSWKPDISLTRDVQSCRKESISIMTDPDRKNSKTDVIFYATKTDTHQVVRVLVQLTLADCPPRKIADSFEAMSRLDGNVTDLYLFLGPNSRAQWLGSENLDDLTFVYLKGSALFNRFEFPINVMCNPNDTDAAIEELVKKAEAMGECTLAEKIAGDMQDLSLNKKRRLSQTTGEIKKVYSRAKNSEFSYQNRNVLLNTQPFLDWTLLVQEVRKVFQIAEQSAVHIYKKQDDGTLSQIIDISEIEDKGRYSVQTDTGPKITEMETFFERLKNDQGVDDDDIVMIKDCLAKQKIRFKQLMATGELALTDAELKEYGIAQGGLRKAILAIIKSNQNKLLI